MIGPAVVLALVVGAIVFALGYWAGRNEVRWK